MSSRSPGWYRASDESWVQWWNGKASVDAFWPVRPPRQTYLPQAERYDISIPGEPRYDIVGEAWREREILAAIGRDSTPRDIEFEGYGVADLVLEPDNPNDRNAVSVRIDGYNVGYLPKEDAALYAPVIGRFVSSGIVPSVRARIWGVTRFVRSRGRDELKSAIRLALPDVHQMMPANTPPALPHYVVPDGRVIQVTGEEKHLEALAPYVNTAGSRFLATLHPIAGKRDDSTVLEVRLDGSRIGQLTPGMSANLMPLVDESERLGRVAATWCTVSGSRLAAEARLHAKRADEIDDTWPSDRDRFPILHANGAVPGAYAPQVTIEPPPAAHGIPVWLWVMAVVVALILLAIPYIGWLLGLGVIAGAIVWHMFRRRQPPSLKYRSSAG